MKKTFHGFVLILALTFAVLVTPLLSAQEKQGDMEKEFTLDELLNMEITTAGKQKEKISDIPASVVVVTREDIETYGYQSLTEILENIPGLYVTNDYTARNVGVRGFWSIEPQRNLIVLVNDIPQKEYLLSSNILEQMNIPVEAIDRIEVVRGPMSVMYGSGAFFGAINIKTNVVKEYDPVSMVAGAVGSEKTKRFVVRASGKEGDLQYSFNGSFDDTYGIDEPLDKMVSDPTILPGLGVPQNHTTGGQLESTGKYFNFSGAFKGFSFDASFVDTQYDIMFLLPSLNDGTAINGKAFRLNFGYKKTFSNKVRAEAKFVYFLNRWTFDYDYIYDGIYSRQANSSSGYRTELLLFWDPTPHLNVTLGLSYNIVPEADIRVDIPDFNFSNYHMNLSEGESMVTQAVYSQVNYRITDKFKIVAGLRLEQTPEYAIEDIYNEGLGGWTPPGATAPLEVRTNRASYSYTRAELIPRLAVIYGPNERNYFKFLYGKAINRPSFFQSRDLLANPGIPGLNPLEPEFIRTFELNYIGNLSSQFSISLSLFHNILDQLIYRTFFADEGQLITYQANVGEMTTNGVELALIIQPSRKLNLEISGTYQETNEMREGVGEIIPGYSPKFLGYIKASWFLNRDISLALTGNYVGEMESYFDNTLPQPDRLGEAVDGYFLLGANFRARDLFGTGLFLNLRVSNLLDQEVRYPTTSNNFNFINRGTIGRGFSFLFTLGYKF